MQVFFQQLILWRGTGYNTSGFLGREIYDCTLFLYKYLKVVAGRIILFRVLGFLWACKGLILLGKTATFFCETFQGVFWLEGVHWLGKATKENTENGISTIDILT